MAAGPSLTSAALPPIVVLVSSVSAAVLLLNDIGERTTKYFALVALVSWIVVRIIFFFAMLTTLSDVELGRTISYETYLLPYSLDGQWINLAILLLPIPPQIIDKLPFNRMILVAD